MSTIYLPGVVHQRQLNRRACWYTCLQMMVQYHREQLAQSPADLISPEDITKMHDRFAAGKNPSWAEWRAWAQECGFEALDQCPAPEGVYDILGRRGPIMYSGTWGNTFDGHVVIITGINTDGPTLFVDDPLETSAPVTKNMNTYFERLRQSLWENPLFVY